VPRGATPAKRKVAARPSAVNKSRRAPETTIGALEARLAQALEQQAATSEILRVISASPAHVEPVLEAVAEYAARLCRARFARVMLVEDDMVNQVVGTLRYVRSVEFVTYVYSGEPQPATSATRAATASRRSALAVTGELLCRARIGIRPPA